MLICYAPVFMQKFLWLFPISKDPSTMYCFERDRLEYHVNQWIFDV